VTLGKAEELGGGAAWAGAGLLAGSAARALGLLRSGPLADTWGRRPALVLGAGLGTASPALLVLPPATGVFLASMAAYGLAASPLAGVPATLVGDVSPARAVGWWRCSRCRPTWARSWAHWPPTGSSRHCHSAAAEISC
jgi:MFS family permease